MRTHDENYVQRVTGDLSDLLPGCYPDLIPLYALLAITRGPATTLEDVHDAWSIWCNATDPKHRSLKPFSELAPDVQELDRKYMEAIHKAAVVLDGPYAGERCACGQGEPTAISYAGWVCQKGAGGSATTTQDMNDANASPPNPAHMTRRERA